MRKIPLSQPFPQGEKGERNKAFTLVELIVVITILAILGTIAFLSMQGYGSNARDSVRTTDLSNLKTSLSVYYTKVGTYPDPSNPISVTYSGAIVWNQGTFGNVPFKQLGDVSKLPTDPLTNNEYSYSTTSTKTEYELAGVYEGAIAQNKELLNQTYAAQINGTTKIFGTYNGVQLYTQTGGITYTIFSPTITTSDSTTTDLQGIITGNKLVLSGKNKLPINYQNGSFKDGTVNLGLTNIVISTGSISELTANTQSGKDLRKTYLTNLQSILTGSTLKTNSNYANIISLDVNSTNADLIAMSVVTGKPVSGGNSSTISTTTTPVVINYPGCDTPDITVGAYTISACNVGTNTAGLTASSYGNYYQWGNNGGTPSGTLTPSTTLVNASGYGPGNYYNNTTFIGGASLTSPYDWTSPQNDNLWGNTTNTAIARQGPCASGYHVPSKTEWSGIVTAGGWSFTTGGTSMQTALKMPFAGIRHMYGSPMSLQVSNGLYWSSSLNSNSAHNMYLDDLGNILLNDNRHRAYGLPIRCFKN